MRATDIDTQDRSLQKALRAYTQNVHQQLHEHSHFVALFDGTIALSQYRALMQAFHGFYVPMERAIDRAFGNSKYCRNGFDYPPRATLLESDLAHLGLDTKEIKQNPRCAQIENVVTPGSLAGVLYVIEGSTLGAALIDRAAQNILSAKTTGGRSFWAWSRANNKTRWAAINTYLTQVDHAQDAKDAILEGANDTFEALATWLAPLDEPIAQAESAIL